MSENAPPQRPSKYAEEGTAAHKLGEYCFKKETFPDAYYGRSINGFPVDDDMILAVEKYLNTVYEDVEKFAGKIDEQSTERYIEMDHIHPDLGGTCDYILSTKRKLVMYDYKHGKGVDVDAEENTQGLNYLLGYATRIERKYSEYEFVIIQPRLDDEERHIKRWSCNHRYLMKFKDIVLNAIQEAESDDPPIKAGDWCRFCPASGGCPALHNKALTAASADFTPMPEEIGLMLPSELSTEQLLMVLDNRRMISDWLKKVSIHAYHLLKQGEAVGDYKLVRGKSNRKWIDEVKAIKKLERLGYDLEDLLNTSLKSPTQVEKIIDDKEEIEDLWFKPEGRLTLAAGNDKRKAVSVDAASDFDVIEDDESEDF